MPTNSTSPGRITAIGATPAKSRIDNQGVLKRGCNRRKTSGICRYVAIAYVIETPDHTRVGGDEEDRRREHADVELQRIQERALDAEVLDDAEHRVVREAASSGGSASVVGSPLTSWTGRAESATSGSVK